jgi:hypothetical protein
MNGLLFIRRKLEEVRRLFHQVFPHGVVRVFVGIDGRLWVINRMLVAGEFALNCILARTNGRIATTEPPRRSAIRMVIDYS